MTTRPLIVLLAALLPLCPTVRAQVAPAEPSARAVRFYYAGYAQPGDLRESPQARFTLRNGRERVPFALNANSFSSTLDYTGTLPAPLLPEAAATGPSGATPAPEPIGELRCPDSWKGVLFLVLRDPANAAFPFSFHPVECWGPSVPDGCVRILNLCPQTLAAKVGSGQSAVNARAALDFPMPANRDDVPLMLAVGNADQWERILSTSVSKPEQNKMLLVVFPNSDGHPRVVVVRQLPEPPAQSS